MKQMELANPIANAREEELSILSTSVNPVRLKNNPVELSETVIRNIYNSIIK